MRLKNQFRLLLSRNELWLSFGIMLLLCLVPFFVQCALMFGENYYFVPSSDQLFIGKDRVELSEFLYLLLPLILVFPFSDSYFIEKQNKSILTILPRFQKKSSYILSKAVVVFVSSFLLVLVPLLLNWILNLMVFPSEALRDFTDLATDQSWYYGISHEKTIVFPDLLVHNPNLYNLIFGVGLSLFSGVAAVLTFAFSFFVKKNRIVVLLSFFIFNGLLELITSLLGEKGLNFAPLQYLFAYFDAPGKSLSDFLLLIGAILAAILIMSFVGSKKLKENIE